MGKIIRNGIEFCGTADEAFNIIYNNADSGLAATTAQAAIDELNDKIKTGGGSNIRQLTQAEYNALSEEEKMNGTEYRITDANLEGAASNIVYDNATSGLAARNLQTAVDELNTNLGGLKFGTDGEGNFGYFGADGSLIPFKRGETIVIEPLVPTLTSSIGSDGGEAFASSEYNNVRNAWRAFSNEVLDPVVAGSGYWYPNLNQTDSWLAYDFKVPTVVKEFKMSCAAQTAGDVQFGFQAYVNNNWETVHTETCNLLTNENANNYKLFNFKFDKVKTASKWRIVTYGTNAVAIHAAQFYGYRYEALVPILTSNTADDGGLALASSFQTGYEQWRVFDGNKSTYWVPANVTGSGQSVIPAYVQYNLTKPEIVKAFKITNTLYGYDCKDIVLYGVNNNNLTEIGKYVAPAGVSAETIFYVENENAYTSYRLTINTGHGNYVGMSELQFYAAPEGTISTNDLEPPVLLWTNPDPTVAFAAQTIALNLEGYTDVLIETNYWNNDGSDSSKDSKTNNLIPIDGSQMYVAVTVNTSINTAYCARNVSATATGVTFTDALTTDGKTMNSRNIPLKIYGVKETLSTPTEGCNLEMNWNQTWTQNSQPLEFKGSFKKMTLTYTATNYSGGMRVIDGHTNTELAAMPSTSTAKIINLDLTTDYIILRGAANSTGVMDFNCVISNIKFE